MPWKEVSMSSQRLEFVSLAGAGDINISELCRRFEVSRQTAYKWLARFKTGGPEALVNQSRRPRDCPHRTADQIESLVLHMRQAHPTWGGRKIRARLATLGHTTLPAPSTISDILRRHGLIDGAESRKRQPFVRFERQHPNELWQMDFKGDFATAAGRCHPLTVLDDHSRFNLVLAACGNQRTETVQAHLTAAFRRYGMPFTMLSDNGSPFGGTSDHGLTRLGVWLIRLGIGVIHGRPYHPQTQGKEERFHRTLKADVITGQAFKDCGHVQNRFDPFRQTYNFERPHEALGMKTPSEQWEPSERSFPESIRPTEYDEADQVRKVQDKGIISFKGKPWKVADCLKGEAVALRPSDIDGVYDVRFCTQTIAQIDLRGDNR